MALVAEGLSDRQIARRLGLSESTVGKHLEQVYQRTGARSRVQAVRLCTVPEPALG
jgi:two-component system, NarL family, nitrate/nitrite response regulator NarL